MTTNNALTPAECLQKILDALGIEDLNINSRGLFEGYIKRAALLDAPETVEDKIEELEKPIPGFSIDERGEDEILQHAIDCCNAWVDDARLIGNVRAKDLGDMLRSYAQSRQSAGVDDEESELKAFGKLVKNHMNELLSWGDIASHIGTTFKDKDEKEWTVRTYIGEPDEDYR